MTKKDQGSEQHWQIKRVDGSLFTAPTWSEGLKTLWRQWRSRLLETLTNRVREHGQLCNPDSIRLTVPQITPTILLYYSKDNSRMPKQTFIIKFYQIELLTHRSYVLWFLFDSQAITNIEFRAQGTYHAQHQPGSVMVLQVSIDHRHHHAQRLPESITISQTLQCLQRLSDVSSASLVWQPWMLGTQALKITNTCKVLIKMSALVV